MNRLVITIKPNIQHSQARKIKSLISLLDIDSFLFYIYKKVHCLVKIVMVTLKVIDKSQVKDFRNVYLSQAKKRKKSFPYMQILFKALLLRMLIVTHRHTNWSKMLQCHLVLFLVLFSFYLAVLLCSFNVWWKTIITFSLCRFLYSVSTLNHITWSYLRSKTPTSNRGWGCVHFS